MGSLKEELEKWKKSRYQKPMSVALAEVREGHDCDKEHPKRSHKDWMNTEPVKTVKEDMFDEGRMKDIYTMDQEGKSPEEIAKKLKINVKTVKGILGEETLHEFSDAQISQLKKEYEPLRGKTISGPNATKLMSIFDKFDKNKQLLIKILKANIPFVSMLAQARLISKHGANAAQLAQMRKEELEEAKMPFRLSYDDKYGKHAGFEDAKTLQDLQNKAQKLRAKGFKINKMGRNTSPVEQKLPEPEGKREVEEDTDYLKSRLNPTQINNIKKTWSMKTAKDITPAVRAMIKKMDIPTQLAIKQANIPHLSKLVEGTDEALIEACWKGYTQVGMKEKDGKEVPNCVPNKDGKIPPQKKQEDKAHAIGMAKAKEIMKDEPPLEKKTIKKAHDIAKAIKKDESINSRTGPQKTFERIWMQHKRGDKRK